MGKIFSNLRVVLAERGLNITKLNNKTTVSRTTISNLYHNYSNGIQFDTLEELCRVLNCQPGDLFFYEDIVVDVVFDDKITENKYTVPIDEIQPNIVVEDTLFAEIICYVKFRNSNYTLELSAEAGFKYKLNGDFEKTHLDFSIPSYQLLEQQNFPYYIVDYIKNEIDKKMFEEVESTVKYLVSKNRK